MNSRADRRNKAAFSNFSGIMWMGPKERTKLLQVLCIKDEGFKCWSLETCIFTVLESDGYVCLKVSIFLLSCAWFFPFFIFSLWC